MEFHSFDEEAVWYAIDYDDNRDRESDKRCEALIVPMSKQAYQRLEERHGKISKGGKINLTRRYHKLRSEVLKKCVREIKNMTLVNVRDGVKETTPVVTAEQLLSCAPSDVLDDILEAIKNQSVLAEGVLGKSDSQSVSSS